MVEIRYTGDALWDRIERAVQKVKDRLERVAVALEGANIPYAVIGGTAVQLWVAQVDESAVRNTRNVDIVLNRRDLNETLSLMEATGVIVDPKSKDGVHLFFAGEKVRSDDLEPIPLLQELVTINNLVTFSLPSLVQMKLTCWRHKHKVHLLDLISIGLIDESWLTRFDGILQSRLQELLDDPEG